MMKNNYKVLIISCWSLLGVCCVLKLLGLDIFLVGSDNERFITLCNYIDNSFIKYFVYFVFNIVTSSIYYMAVLKEKKPNLKWLIPYMIYAILKLVFNQYDIVFNILDFIIVPLLPIIINKKYWLRAIIGLGLMLGFQAISLIIKLDHFTMFDNNTLMGVLLSIDYIIMLMLYWLYSIREKKGGN